MSVETQSHIGCLVVNVTSGKLSKGLQDEVEHHLSHCGVEWTCDRQKSLWNIALHLRNGDKDKAIALMQAKSIAYHKKTGYPKGCWGVAVKRFCEAQKPSVIRRYAAVLRFYTSLKLDSMSSKQREKALMSITSPSKNLGHHDVNAINSMKEEMVHGMKVCLKNRMNQSSYRFRPIREKDLHAEKLRGTSYYYSKVQCPKDMRMLPYARMTLSLISSEWVPSQLDFRTPCQEMRNVIRGQGYLDTHIGRVVCLQEQGCKARVVCQPTAWLQLAFMPLHDKLARATEELFPLESCVTDQTIGAYAVQQHIAEGKDVYSVDLSSATDRFPRDLTIPILGELGYPEYGDALEEVCQRSFECDFSPSGEVSYSVGQPMGLYGSFPMFNLSNALFADVCATLSEKHHPGRTTFRDGTHFKVLGDDIVFSDGKVASLYKKLMTVFGVEVSAHKSFEGKVAEFAGFIAVPTRGTVTVFRPYKVPCGDTITNPLDFIHGIGGDVCKLGPWWDKQFRAYAQTLGQRDISLTPFATDDRTIGTSSFRGDNHWIISLSNRFSRSEIADDLPDLGGETKINRSPLFHERGPMDYYGFNAEAYRNDDRQATCVFRTIPKRIMADPLISDWHRQKSVKTEAHVVSDDSEPYRQTGKTPMSMDDWRSQISKSRNGHVQSPSKTSRSHHGWER